MKASMKVIAMQVVVLTLKRGNPSIEPQPEDQQEKQEAKDAVPDDSTFTMGVTILGKQVKLYAKSLQSSVMRLQPVSNTEDFHTKIIEWLSGLFKDNLQLTQGQHADTIGNQFVPESTVAENDGSGSVSESEIKESMHAACVILPPGKEGAGFVAHANLGGPGSGLTPVLVTNSHVLPNADIAMDSTVRFYGNKQNISLSSLIPEDLHESEFFKTSPTDELDFAIIRLNENKLQDLTEIHLINISEHAVADFDDGDVVYVFQSRYIFGHMEVYMSSSQCYAYDLYMVYGNETRSGSSGSPVMKVVNGKLMIVGLHRAGGNKDTFNMGVRFKEILNKLCGRPLNRRESKEIPVEFVTILKKELSTDEDPEDHILGEEAVNIQPAPLFSKIENNKAQVLKETFQGKQQQTKIDGSVKVTEELLSKQANLVRTLKSSRNASKEVIDVEVKKLIEMRKELGIATGIRKTKKKDE